MSGVAFRVRVEKGPGKGKRYPVKNEALVLGSSEEAHIVIQEEGVEPAHAQITFEGGQVKLEDLSREAGTFRNGKRLLGPIQIFPGDRIGLGPNVVLILDGEDPAAEGEEDPDLGLADTAEG